MIKDIIALVINERTNKSGSVNIYKEVFNGITYDEIKIDDEIIERCKEFPVELSIDIWCCFESPAVDVYALSIAWIEDGKLQHYTDTLICF